MIMGDSTIPSPGNHPTTARAKAGIPRPVEAVVSVMGLLVSAPLLALAALAIVCTSRGPVLYRQERIGRNGRSFVLYKLRTMRVAQGGPQVTARDDARVTWAGRLLRRTKLDEVPQLLNVLKGDMSLVGPRPEVPRYINLDDSVWRLVLEARPGITDPISVYLRNEELLLAEVKGDRERFYREILQPLKLRGYLEYLQRRSWRSDISVLCETGMAIVLPDKAPPPTLKEILAHTQQNSGEAGTSRSRE